MVPWRATEDGFVNDAVVSWYERFARGRPGAIVVEATGIRDVPSGPLLRIGHDRYVEGLRRLTSAVRAASGGHTRLFIQLIDFLAIRRRPQPSKYFARFLRITESHRRALDAADWPEDEVRARLAALDEAALANVLTAREMESLRFGYRERVTDLDLAAYPRSAAGVAGSLRGGGGAGGSGRLRRRRAALCARLHDGVVSLSRRIPATTAGAAHARLACACRSRCSPACAPGSARNSSSAAGFSRRNASRTAARSRTPASSPRPLRARGWISSRPRAEASSTTPNSRRVDSAAYPYTGPSGYECMPQYISDQRGPFGRNADATKSIREAVRAAGLETPVVCTGGVHNFEMAEEMLARGVCDIVGAARQSLADPDWFLKTSLGLGDAVRTCEFTNYCEGLDQKHKQVTCQLWDKEALSQPGVALTTDGKRRLNAPDWSEAARGGNQGASEAT